MKILYLVRGIRKKSFFNNIDELYSRGNNTGNMVFETAVEKYISYDSNEIDYMLIHDFRLNLTDEQANDINNKYDIIIVAFANCIAEYPLSVEEGYITTFLNSIKKIKIPFNIIGMGAQGSLNYEQINLSIKAKDTLKEFIDNVLRTKGKIGLRGYYTGSIFSDLGYTEDKDYTVTGCPSIYYEGRDLKIENEKISKDLFNPIFNGNEFLHTDILSKYSNSLFIDQDWLYEFILSPRSFLIKHPNFINSKSSLIAYIDNRIKIWGDYMQWKNAIKSYNFSIGTRIHGNILPILVGMPSHLIAIDSRTRELAEYNNIPYTKITEISDLNNIDLYDIYCKTDYTKFNENYLNNFDKFKNFFDSIVPNNLLNVKSDFDKKYYNGIDCNIKLKNRHYIRKLINSNIYEKNEEQRLAKIKKVTFIDKLLNI